MVGLGQRCAILTSKFHSVLGYQAEPISFLSEIVNTEAIISLGGRASELIERNVGKHHRVVQLCALSRDLFGWVGFRERWQRSERQKNLRFLDVGFTIHVGKQGEVSKPQIMRSEWVGQRSRNSNDHVGHPHWQIDLLQTVRTRSERSQTIFAANSQDNRTAEFGPVEPLLKSDDPLLTVAVERMHLASAAPWWQEHNVQIANAPKNLSELDRWIVGCLSYMQRELKRC